MHVVVMGVTGCGKSTVGRMLARAVGAQFADGDDFHAPDAVAKMAANVPLTDDDRWPWLARVGQWLGGEGDRVVACSALKRSYREAILAAAPDAFFVHLRAPQATLEARVAARAEATGHFAGPGLLDSQFATLEELHADEPGIAIDVSAASPSDAARTAQAAVAAPE